MGSPMADIDLTTGSTTIGDATFSKTTPIGAGIPS
jgi:hypothetical protein